MELKEVWKDRKLKGVLVKVVDNPAMAVIASGLAGSVVDSAIFLSLAFGSIEFLAGQVLGKFWMSLIAGALIVAWRRLKMHTVHEHLQMQ